MLVLMVPDWFQGVRGLYRGLVPTMFGLAPTWAIFFTTYKFLQRALFERMFFYILL